MHMHDQLLWAAFAITHSLYIEDNLLQTGSGREEAQDNMRIDQCDLNKLDQLISSPLFATS